MNPVAHARLAVSSPIVTRLADLLALGLAIPTTATSNVISSPCRSTGIKDYNEARTHQGRWCFGKTPMQTFIDTLPLAKEKLLQVA
jgi:hypothetical protein